MNSDTAALLEEQAPDAPRHVEPAAVWVHLLVVLEDGGPMRSSRAADTLPNLSRTAVYDALIALIAAGLAHRTAPGDFLVVEGWRERIRTAPCPGPLSPVTWVALGDLVRKLEAGGEEVGAQALLPESSTLADSFIEELEVLRRTYKAADE